MSLFNNFTGTGSKEPGAKLKEALCKMNFDFKKIEWQAVDEDGEWIAGYYMNHADHGNCMVTIAFVTGGALIEVLARPAALENTYARVPL